MPLIKIYFVDLLIRCAHQFDRSSASENPVIIQIFWSYLPVNRASSHRHHPSSNGHSRKEIVLPRGGGCAVPPTPALTHSGTDVAPRERSWSAGVVSFSHRPDLLGLSWS